MVLAAERAPVELSSKRHSFFGDSVALKLLKGARLDDECLGPPGHVRRLIGDADVEPGPTKFNRRRHAGGAGSDDQHVGSSRVISAGSIKLADAQPGSPAGSAAGARNSTRA